MGILIRPARTEDDRHIAQVHIRSVHGTGAKFYSEEICNEWSPSLSEKRIKGFSEAISSAKEIMFVAETEGQIVGFASIVVELSELRAVYVDPKFGRMGIGKLLLEKVEQEARNRNLRSLKMHASLSAEAFYKCQGYIEVERVEHILLSGRSMPAVEMEKVLPEMETCPASASN